MSGVYEQKIAITQQNKQVEYRFIPRTYYEEQMGEGAAISDKYGEIFEKESPWFDRTVGPIINIDKPNSLELPK